MKAIFTLIFSLVSVVLLAQPAVEWDKSFGTSSQEFGRALVRTQDGGYLMGGEVSVASNDFLVIKVDAAGNETWRYSYDNNGNYDRLNSIAENIDGGFVLGGYTYSSTVGNYDYWIVKINANGFTEWTVQLDGNSTDMLEAIKVDPFGDIVAGGYSVSGMGGDKTEPSRGGYDMWIVKLNNNGYKIWDKTIGGSSDDLLMSIDITSTGDYLLGGYSYSSVSGEKTEMSRGGSDYWIVKTNNAGNIIWNKTIGGSLTDILSEIKELPNGEITLAGYSQSQASGDKTQNTIYNPQTVSYTNCYQITVSCGWLGGTCYETVCYPVYYTNYDTDYWIVKLSASGGKIWDRDFGSGGSFPYDNATNVSVLNGEILITGFSNGNANSIKSENSRGGSDAWLIKIDLNGNKLWDKTIGGNTTDQSDTNESVVVNDGKITFLASSYSPVSGDKTSPNFGVSDFWLVSLVTEPGDEEPPVISGMPTDILAENDPGSCYTVVTWIPPTATDNKGVVSFTSNYQPGDLFSYGANQVIYTATDAAGNSTQASFYVYVQDNEAPTFAYIPENILAEAVAESCSATVELPEIVVLDNCEEYFLFGTRSDGEEIPLTDPYPVGTTTITYEAYDMAENLATLSFTVTVVDMEAPTFNSEDLAFEVFAQPGQCQALIDLPIIDAFDDCGVTLTKSFEWDGNPIPDPVNIFQVGTTRITYTATDTGGNEAFLTITVVVIDNESPVITQLAPIEVDAEPGACSATIDLPWPITTDNCAIASVTKAYEGDVYPVGETIITWTVVDIHGNTATTTQTIVVNDVTPPTIVQSENIILSGCEPIAIWETPLAADACGSVTIDQTAGPESGSPFEAGTTTTITYTASDVEGNQTSMSFTVTRDPELMINAYVTNGTCTNGNLGSIAIEVTGGLEPYTYSWSSGETTADLSELPAGEYLLTVTDSRGCSKEQTIVITTVPCCNVTAGGLIEGDESNCGPFNPVQIASTELPSGGLGEVEYVWVATTNSDLSSGIEVLENSNSPTYDPAPISVTTWYRRGARRAGCVEFVGESNWVKKEVFQNVTNAGTIAADQQNCGPFTPTLLTSITPAQAGPEQVIEYQWMSSTVDVPNSVGNPYWQPIAGATEETYQPGALGQSTYFIRCARVQGCSFVGATTESNKVSIHIFENVTNAGTIAADQQNCGPFTPAPLTSVSPAVALPGQIIEYQWMSSTVNVPNTVGNPYWTPIVGATESSYQSSPLDVTTYFIRCARVQGCSFIGSTTESNTVAVTVLPVPVATLTAVDGTCLNGNLGNATVQVTGGQEPFTYLWNTGATTASIDNLEAGEYTVVVTDANQCSTTTSATVTTENCIPVLDLNLTSECYEDPAERRWRITNPNEFDVEVTWRVYGSTQSGTLTAAPGITYFITIAQAGPNTTIIEWLNEKGELKQVTKASSNKPCCLPSAITDRIVDFDQGQRRDGKDIIWYRSNPDKALGKADAKDSPHGGIRFVSLGFGGSITLEFDNQLCDKPGNDLRVYETSYGNPMFALYPEQAEVFVSQDGNTWKSLGRTNTTTPSVNCRVKLDTDFDISGAYSWIKFVRVVDVTNPNAKMLNPAKCTPLPVTVFNKASDGFDLDAIESLENGKPNGWPAGREMADAEETEEVIFISNPSAMIYPNPVERELLIDLEEEEEFVIKEDEAVHLEIMDMKGIRHQSLNHNLDNGLLIRCDVSSLSPGLYLARTQTNGIIRTYKFVKQ